MISREKALEIVEKIGAPVSCSCSGYCKCFDNVLADAIIAADRKALEECAEITQKIRDGARMGGRYGQGWDDSGDYVLDAIRATMETESDHA